jgi:Cu/Ag efflux protein CusF
MHKIAAAALTIALVTATAVHAQSQGGGGHGGHGGRRGSGSPPPATAAADTPRPAREVPLNQIEIIGVIRAIDPAAERLTIAYDAVEQLNWPAGVMPFAVGKSGLLGDAKVGQKVRFRLESQRIVDLKPF